MNERIFTDTTDTVLHTMRRQVHRQTLYALPAGCQNLCAQHADNERHQKMRHTRQAESACGIVATNNAPANDQTQSRNPFR